MALLHRYWFTFDVAITDPLPRGFLKLGCCVTAYTCEDALNLVRERVFRGGELPPIRACIEDVDIRTLDRGHVLPNIASPIWRGIWYPRVLDFEPDMRRRKIVPGHRSEGTE